jgi:predicted amidohydrolase
VLRVTVLELPAAWGDSQAALGLVDAELERGPPTDLVLLPEASLSGYVSEAGEYDLAAFAEPHDGPTARAIAALARRHRTNIVAPLVLAEGACMYNAMAAFDRRGDPLFTYRKRHPWFPELWATPGLEPAPIARIDGLNVTIAICFDVHFLAEDAQVALDACDLLLFPSAWVEEQDSREAMLADLARRHRIAIANANWGPGIVRIPGQGGSSIVDSRGRVLAAVTSVASVAAGRDPDPRVASRRVIRADAEVVGRAASKVELTR